MILALAVPGCGQEEPTAPLPPPHTAVPSPDVRVQLAHFPLNPYEGWAPALRRSRLTPSGSDIIYVGQPRPPLLDFAYAGSFPDLGARVTIDGQDWWDTTIVCVSREGYEDQSIVVAPPWSPADTGTYVIAMSLDPGNSYPELNEGNNSDTLFVRAYLGNLWALEIELTTAASGTVWVDTVPVETPVNVVVRGNCWGSFPTFRMVLEENGSVLIDSTVSCESGFDVGSLVTQMTWVAHDPGVHTFTLYMDPDAQFTESVRWDNEDSATLEVVP